MKPVLVLQHLNIDGPAYLATWLQREGVAFELRNTQAGQAFPDGIDGYRAMAVLGGEISANDELPSLRQAERLIRECVAIGVPVVGHCLGGQLMARALGARIGPSPAPEVGWQTIRLTDAAQGRDWFGDLKEMTVFQWHEESFDLPAGAACLASSDACPHQAFSLGPHLAMQFHVEVDDAKLQQWSTSQDPHYLRLQSVCATVQGGAAMRAQAHQALAQQQGLADRLYARWQSAAG
jgi:GMP synthase (glutamine-hydrolysing)